MKKLLLISVIVLAFILRFYQLGVNPPSLDWDEASIGYNAYSILKTGADEYGNKFPLTIRSFDDHKPPAYVYLTVASVALFGLNEFAIRFPSTLLGVLTVLATYFLVKELLHQFQRKPLTVTYQEGGAILAALLLAISPWHLQFSRAAFEGSVGLFFLVSGVYCFLKGLAKPWFLVVCSLCIVFSMYSYHSFRLVVPSIILLGILLFWKELRSVKNYALGSFILLVFLVLPIFSSFLTNSGAESRLSMVSVFNDENVIKPGINRLEYDRQNNDMLGMLFHNRRVVLAGAVLKGYLDHFNPDFLFLHGDGGRQHHAVDMGMLYLFELPFIVFGIFLLLLSMTRQSFLSVDNKKILLLFGWFLLAPLASAITTGTPHPVRAIAMIPPFHIFTAIGIVGFVSLFSLIKKLFVRGIIAIALTTIIALNILYYFHQYYVHTPIEYGDFWQYGYKEALFEAKQHEDQYQKIVMTYSYDQPYIYYLLYNKVDPSSYQKVWDTLGTGKIERMERKIGKYEFRNIDWSKERESEKTLFIGTPQEIPADAPNIIKEIYFPNGDLAFRIVRT